MSSPSLLHALVRAAGTDRGITILADTGPVRLGYAELARTAARVAGGLATIQERGRPLLVIYPTGASFLEAFWGAMWAGLVPAPLPMPRPFSDLEAYAARIAHCSARADHAPVVTTPVIAELLRGTTAGRALRTYDIETLRGHAPVEADPSPIAAIQFTSGSAADPKGTMLSHRAILADVAGMADRLGFSPDDVVTSWVPLVHDMGLIGGLIYPLVGACDNVLIPTERFLADPGIWLRAMSEFRTTFTGAPPFGLGLAMRRATPASYDLSALRNANIGAEPIDARILRAFTAALAPAGLGPNVIRPTYGMAECCVTATTGTPGTPFSTVTVEPKLAPGRSVRRADAGLELVGNGSPLSGFELIVVDDGGRPVADGVIGEIRLRGAARFDGYWGDPDATARALDGEWLLTGDLGFFAGGELYIAGRRKDVIIQRGRHLFPEEIEAIAYDLAGVRPRGALAFGRMDPSGGREHIHLVLETSAAAAEQGELADRARKAVADRLDCLIDTVHFCGPRELPRTPSGKIRRGEGRARWGSS